MTAGRDDFYYKFCVSSEGMSDHEWGERCDKALICISAALGQSMSANVKPISGPYLFKALNPRESGIILEFDRSVNVALEDYAIDLARFGYIRRVERVSKEYAERIIKDIPSIQKKQSDKAARHNARQLRDQARINRPKIR